MHPIIFIVPEKEMKGDSFKAESEANNGEEFHHTDEYAMDRK
jgi:hypothetical protein